jgi:hypothetical protein
MRSATVLKYNLAVVALAMLCAAVLAQSGCGNSLGCGGLTGGGTNGPFTGCTGGSPIPPQSSINFVGDLGTPFSATISDTSASYTFKAALPLTLIYVNNVPPVRVIATNLSTTPALLSIQALSAFATVGLASTTTPGGTISLNVGGPLPALAGPPACDVRFYVAGPLTQNYTALLEQNNNAYEQSTISPTLFLLGKAKGNISGQFNLILNQIGPLKVDLVIDGKLAAANTGTAFTVTGGCP